MQTHKKGFSLIEISVVVLVIALLFAAVSSGIRLVEESRLRGVLAEMEEIKLAYNSFILRYSAPPGDMRHAATFFSGCAVSNVNCNGNGDKSITYNMGNTWNGDQLGDEPAKVFRHLFLAGLYDKGGAVQLPSTFTPASNYVSTTGYHAKSESLDGAGFAVIGVDGGNTGGSTMAAGTIYTGITSNFPALRNGIYFFNTAGNGRGRINAMQAYKLDQKIDDGSSLTLTVTGASTGSFRTLNDASGANNCVTGNVYSISQEATTCIPGLVAD